jgi:hypothetical protein
MQRRESGGFYRPRRHCLARAPSPGNHRYTMKLLCGGWLVSTFAI